MNSEPSLLGDPPPASDGAAAARADRLHGIVCLLATMFLWSFPMLAVKFLSRYMDLYTQNLIRFGSASVFLWAVCLARSRREALSGLRLFVRVLPAAGAAFAYQMLYNRALYVPKLMPGVSFLVVRSTVLWTAVLSCVFFADERSTVRDRRFIVGIVLSVLGLLGLLWAGPGTAGGTMAKTSAAVWGALLLVCAAAFSWSTYSVLVKLLVRRGSPLVTWTYACTVMTAAFAALAATNRGAWVRVPPTWEGVGVWAVAIGSGVGCVGIAHVCYYHGIRALGTSVCATVLLANAFLAPLLSMQWFGERFTVWHVVAGGVLIAGSAVTVQARGRRG